VNVIKRRGVGIAAWEVGEIKIGYTNSGTVTFVVALRDYGGFVEAFKYVVGYHRSECFSVRLLAW
jgi:hypothetical protein